ncbi:MAG: hydrolase [Syntrophomonadaceae bacterium]|jgi:nicotinamidase-related amidase
MSKFKIEAENSLLMIIDLQERLLKAMKDREKVVKNTNLLLATAYESDIPVVVTEQYPKGLGSTVEEIKSNLRDYEYMEKTSFSAWVDEMKAILNKLGRKSVILTGSETHVCVFQTARDLIEDGYNVHLVKDAVCSRFDENYENGLDLMKEAGAVITNTETVVFDILKKAGTPQFKVISPLIK